MFAFMGSKAFLSGLALFMAAFFWGVSFIFQRQAMAFMSPLAYLGIRFTLGALPLLPFAIGKLRRERRASARPGPFLRRNLLYSLGAGAVVFAGGVLQQYGILWTTVAKTGFITSLYVVLVPVLLLAAGRRILAGEILGAVLAAAGLFLLSFTDSLTLSPGDALVLIGAFVWAGQVIYLAWASPRMDPFVLGAGQALVCGLLGLAGMAVLGQIPDAADLVAAWPVLLGGSLVSVTLGFTLQVIGQRGASPSAAAIILQLEAVFAALGGWLFLDEGMTARMMLGAAVMLAGVLVSQLWTALSPAGDGARAEA